LEIDHKTVFDDLEITALNAGHMLGSAQFLVKTPSSSILYTGDINCIDTLTTKAAQPERCDTLVIEATYGSPYYKFPPREHVYSAIVEWALDTIKQGSIPCLHVYAAGKAQEVVRLLNVYTHLPVIVNPLLDGVNDAYRARGHKLHWHPSDTKEGKRILERDPCVYVTTPSDKHRLGRRHRQARGGKPLVSRTDLGHAVLTWSQLWRCAWKYNSSLYSRKRPKAYRKANS
jgi:putative mRNA 3-end processing factor